MHCRRDFRRDFAVVFFEDADKEAQDRAPKHQVDQSAILQLGALDAAPLAPAASRTPDKST